MGMKALCGFDFDINPLAHCVSDWTFGGLLAIMCAFTLRGFYCTADPSCRLWVIGRLGAVQGPLVYPAFFHYDYLGAAIPRTAKSSLALHEPFWERPGEPQRGNVTPTPVWVTPPRILLVDDDQVARKLLRKFLQLFGCTIDVAVDGIGAVNKMNLEKYDLALMVRTQRSCLLYLEG